jgi:hypothetical protein
MANQNGQIYGLTILSPIIQGDSKDLAHATAIRWYLARQPRDRRSPLARVTGTHQARLVVMDDVAYVGAPACEEHLKSRYLVFESNFDGELDAYLMRMATEAREFVHSVWQHCVGYPGVDDAHAFAAYMKKCQVNTTFYFADVNNKTVKQNLQALQLQSALARFIERHQGEEPAVLQKAFGEFLDAMRRAPAPDPGGDDSHRTPQENRPHD